MVEEQRVSQKHPTLGDFGTWLVAPHPGLNVTTLVAAERLMDFAPLVKASRYNATVSRTPDPWASQAAPRAVQHGRGRGATVGHRRQYLALQCEYVGARSICMGA